MDALNTKKVEPCECTKFILAVHDTMYVLSGKWRLPILSTLRMGDRRFKELSKELNGITDKVLSKELKELEVNQLVLRKVYETSPPKVVYSITEHGISLESVFLSLKNWGDMHRQRIIGK